MSGYEYTDISGDTLTIVASNVSGVSLIAEGNRGLARRTVLIEHTDIPTVALELLKAAGQESVIIPRSADEVEERPHKNLHCGTVTVNAEGDPKDLRLMATSHAKCAANYIALAECIEAKASRETEAEKKLQERRDALVKRFARLHVRYDELGPDSSVMRAVNYAIELEDKLAAK